jgi:flagellar hook-associated protein 1
MISPGFFGLYSAQRSILLAQTGINTVNHNIANANTPGYTRQRVDQEALPSLEVALTHGRQGGLGQLGQGATLQAITRVNNAFLAAQIRQENGTLQDQTLQSNILNQVEAVLGEPSDTGIQATMQAYFNAAQEVSLNPESTATRTVFIQAAEDMLTLFQAKGTQLQDLRNQYVGTASNPTSVANSQLAQGVSQVNDIIERLATLNKNIVIVHGAGGQPNDLLDQRDQLLKTLSGLMDVTVTETGTGQVNVSLGGGSTPRQVLRGTQIVDTLTIVPNTGINATQQPSLVQLASNSTTINSEITTGTMGALLSTGSDQDPSILNTLNQLNTLLESVATATNTIQLAGRDLNGNTPTSPVFALATGSSLSLFRYSVDPTLKSDPRLLAAASNDSTATGGFAGVSDGRNALALARIKQTAYTALGNATPTDYWNQTTANVGNAVAQSERLTTFQQDIVTGLDEQHSQASGVNVDQELIDLLRYQRAFEASAKLLSAFDQITQTIINMVN